MIPTLSEEFQEIVEKVLKQKNAFNIFCGMLNHKDNKMVTAAALGLGMLQEPRAIDFLIKKAGDKKQDNVAILYALVDFDCSGYEKELIELGLESTWEGRSHIIECLRGIDNLGVENNNLLVKVVDKHLENIKAKKVVNMVNLEFLNFVKDVLADIPMQETAQILPFPKKIKPI